MAYKLPYKGMSRIPSGKGFTINISEDDLKSKKSASPEPPKEISYDDPKRFAGDDEGMLKNDFKPQFPGDDGYEDQDLNKKQK
jgi:hypothetical protein|tara:strand:+ start:697 stop:945 length:249 start_codon:yes stop_codon:yes gene_type:complete